MTPNGALCPSIQICLYNFQTLLAGVLAIIAAMIAAIAVWRSAHLPLKHQEKVRREAEGRRVQVGYRALLSDLQTLQVRVRQAEGSVKVVIASNASVTDDVRTKVRLAMPALCSDWDFMSLLPSDLASALLALGRTVDSHNFDMAQAGGAFGADSFRELIFRRLKDISEHVGSLCERIATLMQKTGKMSEGAARAVAMGEGE
jgi:hypothetical protein